MLPWAAVRAAAAAVRPRMTAAIPKAVRPRQVIGVGCAQMAAVGCVAPPARQKTRTAPPANARFSSCHLSALFPSSLSLALPAPSSPLRPPRCYSFTLNRRSASLPFPPSLSSHRFHLSLGPLYPPPPRSAQMQASARLATAATARAGAVTANGGSHLTWEAAHHMCTMDDPSRTLTVSFCPPSHVPSRGAERGHGRIYCTLAAYGWRMDAGLLGHGCGRRCSR